MRAFFWSTLFGLVLLSLVAWRIEPRPVEAGKVQLVWVTDDNPVRQAQIDLFNRLHPGIHVTLDPNNQGMEKIVVQSIAGVGPDVFDCFGGQLPLFVNTGIARDVTDDLARAGIDARRIVWKSVQNTMVCEGRIYGLATNAGTNGIWFNRDIFDRSGLKYPKGPWKWKQLVSLAKRLTVRDRRGRVTQFGLLTDFNPWWPQFVLQWGGRMFTPDGTRCVCDSPESIAATQFMQDLIYKYRVMPSPLEEQQASKGGWGGAPGSSTMSWFAAGKAAMAMGGRWWLCSLRNYKTLRLGAVECPYESCRVFLGAGRAVLINKNGPHQREALEFIKFLAGKEYNELVNHQADALGPVMSYAYTDRYLHDPDYPEEDYNKVWRDAAECSAAPEASPFARPEVVGRVIWTQLDLVKANQKSAAKAMKTAARMINEEIQENIELYPSLRAKYEKLTRRTSR